VGLGDQLVKYILLKEYWIKKISKDISGSDKHEKKLLLILRMLAHLREHEKLTLVHIQKILRGTRLRKEDRDSVLEVLKKHRIIKKIKNVNVYVKRRNIFKS